MESSIIRTFGNYIIDGMEKKSNAKIGVQKPKSLLMDSAKLIGLIGLGGAVYGAVKYPNNIKMEGHHNRGFDK